MFSVSTEDHERQTAHLTRCFLSLVTPGEEKTLRMEYGLVLSPWLEDVTPTSDAGSIILKIRKLISDARTTM